MKTKYLAVLLSSAFLINAPAHAVTNLKAPATIPVVAKSKIDLNHANVADLTGSLKGIGKKRAEAIIAYRDSHKGFKALEELAEVKGFSQKFIEKNRNKLNEVFVIN